MVNSNDRHLCTEINIHEPESLPKEFKELLMNYLRAVENVRAIGFHIPNPDEGE